MKALLAPLFALMIVGCATESSPQQTLVERGRTLASVNCSDCHAVGATGESPAPEAPAFRRLHEKYRVDTLQEALAEGISVGHPAMPQFMFTPADVDAMIAYLQSIQAGPPPVQ